MTTMCPKCGGSKQISRMIYSELYKREIMSSLTCACAIKEALQIFFEPIRKKREVFPTDSKLVLDKIDVASNLVFLAGKRPLVYKAAENLLKRLCRDLGWEHLPKYTIVQDSEVWNLWWEKDGLASKKQEWYGNNLILLEVGNKTDEHTWLPKCLLEIIASFLDAGCKVWVLYFGAQEFEKSSYCSVEFSDFLRQTKVKVSEVRACQ